MLIGQVAKVKVSHRMYEGEPQAEVEVFMNVSGLNIEAIFKTPIKGKGIKVKVIGKVFGLVYPVLASSCHRYIFGEGCTRPL